MSDVFVSYKSEDRELVEEIVHGLEAAGFSVWWDQDIVPAEGWRAAIEARVSAAKATVVVWSRHTTDADAARWLIQEADVAERRGTLIPLHVDDVLPPFGLRHRQSLDLVEWHGDERDPRWLALLELVRARVEGREPDPDIARPDPAVHAASLVRRRWPALVLLAGLAAVVVACTVSFGPYIAAGVVAGLLLAYAGLDLLLRRRAGDRAAAGFLRHLLASSRAMLAATLATWLAALAIAATPAIVDALHGEVVITVVDERKRPVPEATVLVSPGPDQRRVVLDENGSGTIAYSHLLPPDALDVEVSYRESREPLRLTPTPAGSFEDRTVPIWSGEPVFEVWHITAREVAIAQVLSGELPAELVERFPGIVGTLRNEVHREASAFVAMFDTVHQFGATPEEARAKHEARGDEPYPKTGLRWPRGGLLQLSVDLSDGLFGHAPSENLPPDLRFLVSASAEAWESNARATPASLAAMRAIDPGYADTLAKQFRIELEAPMTRPRLEWLVQHGLSGGLPFDGHLGSSEGPAYLAYLVERAAPPELIGDVSFRLVGFSGCDVEPPLATVRLPVPGLRLTVVQNRSEHSVPISAIRARMGRLQGIEPDGALAQFETVTMPSPIPALAPGEALIIPRKLFVLAPATPGSPREGRVQRPFDRDGHVEIELLANGAESGPIAGIATAGDGWAEYSPPRVRPALRSLVAADPGVVTQWREPPPDGPRYLLADPVLDLELVVNGVALAQREDRGATLSVAGLAAFEFGSCPYVFARIDGREGHANLGTILDDRIGIAADGRDRIALPAGVSGLELRELDPEVTYVDCARLLVTPRGGETVALPLVGGALAECDGSYRRLGRGETLPLEVPDLAREEGARVELEVKGHYVPDPALRGTAVGLVPRRTGGGESR